MFFVLAKVGGFLLYPSNLSLALIALGLVLWATRRLARLGRGLAVAGGLLVVACGWTPLGNLLIAPLEDRFPAPIFAAGEAPTGIVVLGGALDTHIAGARGAPALNDAGERMTAVADLARRFPQARIVFSGGSGDLVADPDALKEADVARTLFDSFGIDPARVTYERASRDTYENAVFTRDLVKPAPADRWLLVTSGWHMPRSVAIFRKAGFPVEAYPVDYRTLGPSAPLRMKVFASDNMQTLDTAVREWVGLVAYRLAGRTDELFPAP